MAKKKFKARFQVRGYELDGYGHVNHAVYLNYFEYARWCMIDEAGCGADYFTRNGMSPVIVRAEVDYKAPCFLAEWVTSETELLEMRSRVAVFNQKIFKENGTLAAEGKMTLVGVDARGKASSLPKDFETFFGPEEK